MPVSINAVGAQIRVLKGILSGIENKSTELLLPKMLRPIPGAPARGLIKTIAAGHMGDGNSVDAYKSAPGANIKQADPLTFAEVEYKCSYRKLHDLVPKEESRADEELPMSLVAFRSGNLMGTLLRNKDLTLVNKLETETWGQVADLSANAGAQQWTTGSADPIKLLVDKFDAQPMPVNTLAFGAATWRAFRTHKNVLSKMRITEDRAILDEAGFAQLIGDHLGVPNVIVYNMRVHTGAPTATVTPATLTRRFSDKVWFGTIASAPGMVQTNTRGVHEILTQPTAIAHIVEDELDYEEAQSINPQGRLMTCGMSYDIVTVSAALGGRLDNVVA